MKIIAEINLTSFSFWSGAASHEFTYTELQELGSVIEDLYHEGVTGTQINDLFWFEEEFLCNSIGVDYENDYLNR